MNLYKFPLVVIFLFLSPCLVAQESIKDKILETDHGLKGEFVIVLDHSSQSQSSSFEGDELRVMEILTTYLDQKLSLKIASELLDKSRNEIYKLKY